ncbi:phosphoinositide phosphatase SAC2-like [Aristolochia californica]|uniref:phosphoinositide phosphatase SAC2-like n=1 Tax=Aristolochia californica TaxID=171875 RepID=UPI0035DF0CA7
MATENEPPARIEEVPYRSSDYLQKFRLYETRSKFYMIGRNKNRTLWRVLKIDRLELTELNIREDSTTYSQSECYDLLKRIHEGNRSTGGLKFVTTCYGIIGFIKFLGPYYMLLITKRRQIGAICGHMVYAVTKSEMIPLPNSSVQSNMTYSKNENRYKKLLCTVDLTKDFFFSYSYHVMCSLQKNLCNDETGQVLYETMFVWNEFLTRGIRNHLKNTLWTVALVYGFFKQARLSVGRKQFKLTLIARRSRHFAGTRYLKRGVNEKGRVANDVETEQIVFEDVPEGCAVQMSSVVQNRGSIPLFWSQETSRLNIKPDIILQKKDANYEATRLHFENLVKRYGNPIIILNLIKTREKKPRESILRAEFANAIVFINKNLSEENRLKFLHWDLHKHSRSKATNVLLLLGKVAAYALNLTGFFYCQFNPPFKLDVAVKSKYLETDESDNSSQNNGSNDTEDSDISETVSQPDNVESNGSSLVKQPMFQRGVLRTNCIDCLDRTNVAQYAYGLAALGHQLHALGLIDDPKIDLDAPLADDLMSFYETMGDTLALQYGGSAAHNKIFSERRGQWKAATQSQEFFRTLQRYYSNAYMDAEKQDAINVFLGHYQPQQGKPALWELDSDVHYHIGRRANTYADENARSFFKRSLSDGNILCKSNTPVSGGSIGKSKLSNSALMDKGVTEKGLCESTPEISTCGSDVSYSRYTPSMTRRLLFSDRCLEAENIYCGEHGLDENASCSNFLDLDWLSSSGNSFEEEAYERSGIINSPTPSLSSECVVNGGSMETTPTPSENGSIVKGGVKKETELSYRSRNSEIPDEYSDSFVHWVDYGETICH